MSTIQENSPDSTKRGKPVFAHDCQSCVFLGHFESCDLYWCMRDIMQYNGKPTLIARYSDGTKDMIFGKINEDISYSPALKEAKRRVKEFGLPVSGKRFVKTDHSCNSKQ